jgi:hypothetical protein
MLLKERQEVNKLLLWIFMAGYMLNFALPILLTITNLRCTVGNTLASYSEGSRLKYWPESRPN